MDHQRWHKARVERRHEIATSSILTTNGAHTMLKLTVAVLAVALASAASAAGWRKLQIDASSEAAFSESVAAFEKKLSPARRFVLGEALRDIWSEGVKAAKAEQREYTTADYYEQIDGLSYKELVTLTD